MKYIIAFIGKAGAGKDTIAQRIIGLNPDWNMIVSCTTRPKRENETEGVNYYYLTNEEFAQKVLNGDMLEATYFNNWHYGTAESSLIEGVNIGVFNPEGYDCLTEMASENVKVIGIYIMADHKTRLIRQLCREENPDVYEIIRRFGADEEDFEHIDNDENYPVVWIDNGKDADLRDIVSRVNQYLHHVVCVDEGN